MLGAVFGFGVDSEQADGKNEWLFEVSRAEACQEMVYLIRSFKRHYHRVKHMMPGLYSTGSFSFELKFDHQTGTQAKNETPDEGETIRFVNLMRPFLNPKDSLYYRNVWHSLQENFANELTPETVGRVKTFIDEMNKGYIPIKYNDDDLTAEKIYELVAEGQYFTEIEEILRRLNEMIGVPIFAPLLYHAFYSYHERAFVLATYLLKIIHQLEQSATGKSLFAITNGSNNRCIYCLSTSGDFTAEEHVFPESLGNDELILPKGLVCKECNNNVLSLLDSALIDFPPIALLRVQYLPYTKKGKLPKADFENATVERTHPRHIKCSAKGDSRIITDETELDDGRVTFKVHLEGKKNYDPCTLGRALYKIALGMAALDKGQEYACSNKFDAARQFVLVGRAAPNKLLYCKNGKPEPQIQITSYLDLPEGTFVTMSIFGVLFALNLEESPPMTINQLLSQAGFDFFPENATDEAA